MVLVTVDVYAVSLWDTLSALLDVSLFSFKIVTDIKCRFVNYNNACIHTYSGLCDLDLL